MNHKTIKQLPDRDRPYERCLKAGTGALSDAELLAVILRTGTSGTTSVELANEILESRAGAQGLLGLYQASIADLCKIRGIGTVKAVQLQCIAELARRMAKAAAGEGSTFESARAIADYYMEDFRHLLQEKVLLLMFNTKGRLLCEQTVSVGTVNRSCISPREIFMEALRHHAVYVILLHNHPSGVAAPSGEDDQLTRQLAEAGNLIGIPLMDHIVLGDRCYFSYREQEMLQ